MGEKGRSQVILETARLTKHFGEVRAVDGVDMQISQGEVLSIVGPNGAGKTTLLKVLSGGHPIDRGTMSFIGRDVSHLGLIQRAHMGIVYSFQIPALFENLNALDSVSLTLFTREHKTIVFFPTTKRFPGIRQEAQKILKMFNVPETTVTSELPHGQRKLLDVAIAFALKPRLLLLDEPTSGVSTEEKGQVMDTIMPIIRQRNTTAVIVEHDMEIVTRYSHRILVMDQGKVLVQGSPQEVMNNERVKEVLLGHVPSVRNEMATPCPGR
jgi:branched-chain amino acid transport system ATP-binding protein